jgi:hypothetical protein
VDRQDGRLDLAAADVEPAANHLTRFENSALTGIPSAKGPDARTHGGNSMTTRGRSGIGGITTGGVIVIIGIIVAIVWNLWLGIIIALIGLIAFGGFARGKWY